MVMETDGLKADVVICGAGIAGISAAYYLTVKHGIKDVVLIDERPPLTLTSDKSTECYRNWWPGPGDTMVRFMNRSIDLLEGLADESDNFFGLNRRGYVFLTADPKRVAAFEQNAAEISRLGAGPVRRYEGKASDPVYQPHAAHGYKEQPEGADLILDPALILKQFPFLNSDTKAMLHPRRCGWVSAQQLGMYLLDKARAAGARLLDGRVTGVTVEKGRVSAVQALFDGQPTTIQTRHFVNAAGPYVGKIGEMLGVEIPVYNELHGKVSFNDYLDVVPRDLPLMIWSDPVTLPWSEEERAELAADGETRWLTEEIPAGAHFRPEGEGGSKQLLMLWTYDIHTQEPVWPPRFDPEYFEVVMRGMARMIPGLSVYFDRPPKPYVDGGYYCKTRENRPLIGPLPVEGAFMIGALSGYGIMASQAGGELLAAHIAGTSLPDYAPALTLGRYDDPAYRTLLDDWDSTSGQL
jgi:glycine/D-amino acid oxidase-like deaminating enzyme